MCAVALSACTSEPTATAPTASASLDSASFSASNGAENRQLPCGASCLPTHVPMAANPTAQACTPKSYPVGATVNGSWTLGDCRGPDGRRYDQYEITLHQQTAFRAQVEGPHGRAISVRRSGTAEYVQLMASEAFMPSTSNPLQVRYVLAPGSYVFEVAAPDSSTLGAYTFGTSLDAGVTCRPIVFVTPGVTITEEIDPAADCRSPGGTGVEDLFIILPRSGTRLDMTASTSAFAPYLVYRDDRLGPASPTLARDVRHTVGATARVSYTTTFAGFQEIVVGPANAGGSGAYSLTITEGPAANTCGTIPTSAAGSRLAVWETTDCTADGRVHDSYAIGLTEQAAVRVQLSSAATGARSAGFFSQGKEVLDFARTTAGDLTATWYLAAGDYELRTGVPRESAPASYNVTTGVTPGSITCANNATSGNVAFANQTLGQGDCYFSLISKYEDRLFLYVETGQEIVVTMNAAFAPSAVIRDPGSPPGTFLVRQWRADPGEVTAVWRAQTTGYYMVIFSSEHQNGGGAYSGSIAIR